MRLYDPLLAIWVYEYYSSIFTRVAREDLAQTRNIGADERGSVWISSRTSRDAVLNRGVEPL
jgi:hypothetical protein